MSERQRWIVPFREEGKRLRIWKVGPFASNEITTAVRILGELPVRDRPDAAWLFSVEPNMEHIASLVNAGCAIADAPGSETIVMFPRPDRTAS